MKTILLKEHSNGSCSEVLLQPNGLYKAQERPPADTGAKAVGFTTDVEDLERAKAVANGHAHPSGCNEQCGRWIQMS